MSKITAEIVDVAFGGDGVARHEGKVIFVPGAISGEKLEMEVVSSSKRFSRALPTKVVEPSPDRIEVDCPYALSPSAPASALYCAGCCYRHMSYKAETTAKAKQLTDLLTRIAKLESIPDVTFTSADSPDRYRNKIVLHTDEKSHVGFYSADNETVIDIADCKLACEAISKAITDLRADPPKSGDIVFRHTDADGVKVWREKVPGGPPLTDSTPIGDMLVPPPSFAQINREVCGKMVQRIREITAALKPEEFVDLYCGTGLFAIAAAMEGVPSVFGVELDQNAVDCAAKNAKALCPGHANFLCAPSPKGLHTIESGVGDMRRSVILVDPPRRGIEPKLLTMLKKLPYMALIYVSCAPDKLARDIRELGTVGFQVDSLDAFDMFPRTASFETVAVLSRKP